MWLLAGLLIVHCCVASTAAHADDKNAPVTIGVLDFDKLVDGYTKYQDAQEALKQQSVELDEQLKARDLLTPDEGARFDTLIVNQSRTPAEQAELDGLLKAGNDRRAELLALSGKAARTDAENARIKELQDSLKSNSDAKVNLQNALLKILLKQKQTTEKQYMDAVNKIVADVAANRHLSVVLVKDAVVWNAPSVDITDDVLKQLNKK
jgi:Skp family chaperone for outer membrane proteins